ncbi:MAG: peptide chain release factor 1 [Candidatus Omnitrophica bacterium]|nr:peptide chain release factor 1 [Candidatus Omnitrophota bacterium]
MSLYDKLSAIEHRVREIEAALARPETGKDSGRFQSLSRELSRLRPLVVIFRQLKDIDRELADLELLLHDPASEPELKKISSEEKSGLLGKRKQIEIQLEDKLLEGSDPDADKDTLVEIRAGTGGEEAALFASDLFRMYSKFSLNHGFKVELMSSSASGKGGFKEVIFEVSGPGAFQIFRYEGGIHRVQRVPETEASGRIHTSAVTVAVLPEAGEVEVRIDPKDIRIDVFRSSGPGGQSVNTTDSAVRITHLPTGLAVNCQDEKSQHKNKDKAMKILRARLYEFEREKQEKELTARRRSMVGSGDRSGKIRTYNFHDNRVTDHRIGLTLHKLDDILEGHLDELIQALAKADRAERLTQGLSTGNSK